jgi:hypothetical protein
MFITSGTGKGKSRVNRWAEFFRAELASWPVFLEFALSRSV